MKMSTAMLKGYARVGKQARGRFYIGDATKPSAVCALGAVSLGLHGTATDYCHALDGDSATRAFCHAYGVSIPQANDLGLMIEEIAGMLQAIGA